MCNIEKPNTNWTYWTEAHNVLGKAKPKCSWQQLTVSILLVLNNFMKNLLRFCFVVFAVASKLSVINKIHALMGGAAELVYHSKQASIFICPADERRRVKARL